MSFRGIKPFTELIQEEYDKGSNDILLKIGFINQTYIAFIVNEITTILEVEIIARIRTKMLAHGISDKIAKATRIASSPVAKGPGLIAWKIISDYTTLDGFPVAVMIEKGRKAYVVLPLGKENGGSDWLVYKLKDSGKKIFSKKSKIPVYPGNFFVRDTVKERQAIVQEKVTLATQRYVTDIMQDIST